jgi:hypothetical protein
VYTRNLILLSSKISTLESHFYDRSHFCNESRYSIENYYLAGDYYLVESYSIEEEKDIDSEGIIAGDIVDNLVGDIVNIVEKKNIVEDIIDIIAR